MGEEFRMGYIFHLAVVSLVQPMVMLGMVYAANINFISIFRMV